MKKLEKSFKGFKETVLVDSSVQRAINQDTKGEQDTPKTNKLPYSHLGFSGNSCKEEQQ